MNTTEYEHSREDIIAANPLLGYCQECGWQLRRDGRRWKCLCPLHNEDTPSFTIYPDKNLWRCDNAASGIAAKATCTLSCGGSRSERRCET